MTPSLRAIICVCCAWLVTVQTVVGQETVPQATSPHAAIAAAVEKEIQADLFPGAVVLVGTPDKVLYHEAFGFAQVKPKQVPMRKDTLFDIASVTKVVATATALGICKDRGLIDPDAPMTKYLPDHQGKNVDRITLRHLASHTSGFPESPRVSFGGRYKGEALFAQMLKFDPAWPVDTRFQYSCRNLIYLSTIVERVTGQPFGAFCQKEIFAPLEMNDSVFNRVDPSDRVAATHHPVLGENHNIDGRDAGCAIGNAGLFTTAGDLSNFCQMMLSGGEWRGRRILSAETIAEFTRPRHDAQFPNYSFVWETYLQSNHRPKRMSDRAFGHSGYTGISIWLDPEKQVYTIVMTNRTHPAIEGLPGGVQPKSHPRVQQQYQARGRIADAALEALGY